MRASVLVAVIALAMSCSPWGDYGTIQDEASLRQLFQQHRAELEQIRELFAKDSHLVRVAPTFTRFRHDWSWPREDVGLTPERWELYRQLFTAAGLSDEVELQGDQVFFYMSSVGLAVSGASRGVVYSREKPAPIVDSLAASRGEGVFYVPLEGNWYLFHWAS